MEELTTAFLTRQRSAKVNGVDFTGLPLMERTGSHKRDLEKAKELAEEQLNILYS